MIIIPANTLSTGGFDVANSCRFDDGSTDNLARTPSSASNKRTFTMSFWLKRSNLTGSTKQTIFSAVDSNVEFFLWIDNERFLIYATNTSGALTFALQTTQLLRDISSWYNIVVAIDTTQGTDTNRAKIYINGNQVSDFTTFSSASKYPGQNYDTSINTTNAHTIGIRPGSSMNMNGYLCEFCLIDGSQLDATSFGEFDEDSGIWKPISVSGLTFGTNGFYLDFENSGALGADVSGNTNNFTVNNLTAVDQSTDTCTNNFATWNPLVHYSTSATFSEGNLKVAPTENTSRVYTVSTIGMPTVSGSKWYAEFKYLETNDVAIIGILDAAQISYVFRNNSDLDNQNGDTSVGRVTYRVGNGLIKFPSGQSVDSSVTLTNNDIVMIALDSGSGKIWFGVNGTWFNSGNPATGSNGVDFTGQSWWTAGVDDFVFFVGDGNTGGHDDWEANFGSPPYSESGGETDGNGYGNFAHAVPANYYSLNSKNLAEYG